MKRPFVVHPLLFAAVPVLFLYAHNARRLFVAPSEVVLPLLISAGIATLLWLLLWLVLRNAAKSGLITTVVVAAFFLYGHIYGLLFGLWRWLQYWQMASFILAILGLAIWRIVRSRRSLAGVTLFLNVVAAILVLANLVTGMPGFLRNRRVAGRTHAKGVTATGHKPDIYYIIPDGYGRSDVLKEMYGFDNSGFIAWLKDRGFYVATRSRSNYIQTFLSFWASLNMNYLDSLAADIGVESDDRTKLCNEVINSRWLRTLREHGYKTAAFGTGSAGTEDRCADYYLAPRGTLTEFQNVLLTTTPVPHLMAAFGKKSQTDLQRERIDFALDHLPDAAGFRKPVWVFAHIVAPHPPFVFREDGGRWPAEGPFSLGDGDWFHGMDSSRVCKYRERYREQATYITERIKNTIDEILIRSPEPPIIILQADHGPGSRLHWELPYWTDFRERTGILNAYYFPDRDYSRLYDSITPVNTFRLLMDKYFGASVGLLPDRSYYSAWHQPYVFYDVDTYQPPKQETPVAVAVIAFRAAKTMPKMYEEYCRGLAGRRFPGARLDTAFVFLVETLPSESEAYERYRNEAGLGRLPDLGERYGLYKGNFGWDWARVLALVFPLNAVQVDRLAALRAVPRADSAR